MTKMTKTQIDQILNIQDDLNRQAEEGFISDDEACDRLSDILYSYGVDYNEFCDMVNE